MRSRQSSISNPQSARAGGFTLFEIIMVALVLALLLAGTLPGFQRTAERLRLEQGAGELRQLLRYARVRAVTEEQATRWVWDEAARRARIELVDALGGASALTEPAAASRPLPPEATVRISDVNGPVACACVPFFPDGSAQASQVVIEDRGRVYTITVDGVTGSAVLRAGEAEPA